MATWLYPLSSISGYHFRLENGGSTRDTGPASLEELIRLDGRRIADWGITTNFTKVESGDTVWVYYGVADGDRGIVAKALVVGVNLGKASSHRGGIIRLKWDLAVTRRLSRRPFPAKSVRKHIVFPAAAVMAVSSSLQAEIERHVAKGSSAPTEKTAQAGSTGRVWAAPSTISYTPIKKNITVRRRHDALMVPLQTRLLADGWKEVTIDVKPKFVDLAVRKGRKTVIIEAKTIGTSTTIEARGAFAQLAEYSWRFQRGKPSADVVKWALFERKPSDDDVEFLEHYGLLVSWASASKRVLEHGARTLRHPVVQGLLKS